MRRRPIYIIIGALLVVAALGAVGCSAQDSATPTGASEGGSEVRRDEAAGAGPEYRVEKTDDGVYVEVTDVDTDRQSEVLDAFRGCQEGG